MDEKKSIEELRRLRNKRQRVTLTVDEAGTTVERDVLSIDAVPGWDKANVPEGLGKEEMLARSLDIALGLLYNERAMTTVDLTNLVVEVWKVQANYTYGEFAEAAKQDPRFQVPSDGLIAIADEPDPWGVLAARVEQERKKMLAKQRWDEE